jgi:hypothetical protein
MVVYFEHQLSESTWSRQEAKAESLSGLTRPEEHLANDAKARLYPRAVYSFQGTPVSQAIQREK